MGTKCRVHTHCVCSVGSRRFHPDAFKTQNPPVFFHDCKRIRKHLRVTVVPSLLGSREGTRQLTQRGPGDVVFGAAQGSGGKASEAGGPGRSRLRAPRTARIPSPAPMDLLKPQRKLQLSK